MIKRIKIWCRRLNKGRRAFLSIRRNRRAYTQILGLIAAGLCIGGKRKKTRGR